MYGPGVIVWVQVVLGFGFQYPGLACAMGRIARDAVREIAINIAKNVFLNFCSSVSFFTCLLGTALIYFFLF
jgi:hypothetical protein